MIKSLDILVNTLEYIKDCLDYIRMKWMPRLLSWQRSTHNFLKKLQMLNHMENLIKYSC